MNFFQNGFRTFVRSASFLILILSGFAQVAWGQVPREFIGKRVGALEFLGLKRIEKDAVANKITLKIGQTVTDSSVRSDIQSLHAMGYFDEISVSADPIELDQVKLLYSFKERPVVSSIEFVGNERISSSDLKDVTKVKEWMILDINKVREDVNLLQKHYEEKGFYLAKIRHEIESVKDGEVKLTFKINDYDKVKIKKISFLNNKAFSDSELKSVLAETKEGGLFSFLTSSGNFKEAAFKTDLQRLTYYYLDKGYVKFRYENPIVTISDDKKWLYVSIYVEEGERYSMGELSFGGDLLYSLTELDQEVKLRKGSTFSITQRNADIQRLTEKYQDLGYAFVNVVPKMEIRDETKTVDIEYQFEKGNLVYIGEINVLGNSKTHDKVIRRELRIEEGELYNGTRLRISRERVERLGYFAPGEVVFNQVPRKGRDDVVDIDIQIKERSTGTITLGAGYGSIQGFFLQTQIQEINLFGKGQTISFQAQYAADRETRTFNLGFTEPYFMDTRWSTGFDLYLISFPIPNRYRFRRLGFDVRGGYQFEDDLFFYLTYKNEGMNVREKVAPFVDSSLDEGVLSSVTMRFVRDKRNNRFETSGGNYQETSLEFAGVGGDKQFLKWIANNRIYFKLIGDFVFRNSTEVGAIFKTGSRDIPHAERFFLGGPNSMKGYQIYQLSPSLQFNPNNGVPIPEGGRYQFYSLLEVEHPIIRDAGLKFVLFYDFGNAFSDFPIGSNSAFKLRQDYGFGIRWFSPIGPLRFEFGYPVDPQPWEENPVFNFFIGQPF